MKKVTLPRCLESVRGLFDEIVVLDTGSRDRTVEIARSFGARVFDFVWVDDFAAARNAALARATGDYAFWLDADDLIEPPERAKLEALLARIAAIAAGDRPPSSCAARAIRGRMESGGDTVVDHIRLFPVIEGVRWTYRVHEQILPALKRAGVPVQWTDITVRHTGYADRALRSRKLDRDSRILREELAERPDDPFTLFNLGSIAIERAEWNEALGYPQAQPGGLGPDRFDHSQAVCPDRAAHQMQGDFPAASRAAPRGFRSTPKTPSCGSARRSCTGTAASRPRRSSAGEGFSRFRGRRSSPAWTRGSTATSPGETWRLWPRNAATSRKPRGSGGPCWPNAPATGGAAGDLAGEPAGSCENAEWRAQEAEIWHACMRSVSRSDDAVPDRLDLRRRKRTGAGRGRDWPARAHTMIGLKRLANLRFCVETVLDDGIPGDLIETGVWRGGATIFMRAILKARGVTDRWSGSPTRLPGLPAPDTARIRTTKASRCTGFPQLAVSLERVQENFRRYGLLDEQVRFLKGWFRDTLPARRSSGSRCCGSTAIFTSRRSRRLKACTTSSSAGGFLIVDDYGNVPACRQAVHDFRTEHGIIEPIQPNRLGRRLLASGSE